MKSIFGFLIFIFSISSYASVDFNLSFEKCTKDTLTVKHEIINASKNSLLIYEFAMPWSSGDFGVNYKIFYKKMVYSKK